MVLPSGRSRTPRSMKNCISARAGGGEVAGVAHDKVESGDGAELADVGETTVGVEWR